TELAPLVGHDSAVWIDVQGMGDRQKIRELLALLETDTSIKELLFERQQRSHYQMHGKEYFITFHMLTLKDRISVEQISILQVGNTIVTFHNGPVEEIDRIKTDLRRQHSLLDTKGRLYMVQRCMEFAIESYQPILDTHSVELEHLEDRVIQQPERETMQEILKARKELIFLKRLILPLKVSLRQFMRDMTYYSDENEQRVAQELYLLVSDKLEVVEYFISLTSDIMNLHMSSVSNRMNEVMTVLAIVAAIFLPPTLIAGIYGMNFNIPEVHWHLGYPFALALMIGISVFSFIHFWRNGWLKVFKR
ncbi:MAG: magnesium/cobalt transporter CorA, partial [Cyanobacteria bacterium]|nr:magnesium/cobalt transporter CorA [Cyanobacteriota bacterium]